MAGGTTVYDDDTLTQTPDFSLTRDKSGLWTGSQTYYCQKENLETLAPARYSAHPDFSWLVCDGDLECTGEEGGWVRIVAKYYGVIDIDVALSNPPEYAIGRTTADEPLETSPRFVDALSVEDIREAVELAKNPVRKDDGTISAPDQTGWAPLKTELFEKLQGGRESFRDPRTTYSKKWVSADKPTTEIATVGYIDTPDGDPPTLESGRNWMNIGVTSNQRGEVWENEQNWEGSGRGGWDADEYTAP